METTIVNWCYMGIMEKKMETNLNPWDVCASDCYLPPASISPERREESLEWQHQQ